MSLLNRILVFSVCLICIVPVVSAQSADSIIARYQKAMGGANQLRRMDSVIYTGKVTNPSNGQTGTFCWRMKRPDRMELEMDLSGFEMNTGYNGRSAWRTDSRDGLRTLTGNEGSLFKAEAIYSNDRFLRYKQDKVQTVSLGQVQLNGSNSLAIELTTHEGIKRKVYFDPNTFLILREEQKTESGVETISFADYRKVDGIPEPFLIEIKNGDTILKVTIDKVEHNSQIAEAKFDYPKLSNDPLPNIPDLLRDVRQNQDNIDKALDNYTYTEELTERSITNKGDVVDKNSTSREITHYQGERLERVIKKNGTPVTASEEEKETKRLEKRIAEIDSEKRKEEEKKRKLEEQKAQGKNVTEKEEKPGRISLFLRLCDFTNPRRERFRGRDVIVFDFQPKTGIKPKGVDESLVQKLIGVIWVDDQAKSIVRLEARLSDNMKVGGGLLAKLQSGGTIVSEQEFVKNEVWLPSYTEVNLSLKLFMVKGMAVNQTIRYSDYRKFNVDATKATIKDPLKDKKP